MEEYYEAYLGKDPVGKVRITKQGLYCRVVCRCVLPPDTVYRLYALCREKRVNLGVVMPDGDGFLLDRRIPAKQLDGCTQFLLSVRSDRDNGMFVPIRPEEPFSYIGQLENAFLEIRNGQVGIRLKEKTGAV